MAKGNHRRGTTSFWTRFKINDTTSTTNAGKTGLTNASAGLKIAVTANNEATATVYTGANILSITTLGTWAAPGAGNCRFKEIDATNHPGWYELQLEDSRMSVASARSIGISVQVTGGAQVDFEVQLEPVPADVQTWLTSVPAVLTAAGSVKASLTEILGTVLTETAGQIAAAFKKFFDKASPTGTINSLPDAVPDNAGGLPTRTYLDSRTLATAAYATLANQTSILSNQTTHQALIEDIPTLAEFNARTIVSANYATAANQATLATAIAATATPAQVRTEVDAGLLAARPGYAAAIEAAILDEGDATALLGAIAAKVEEFLINEGDATATIAAIATAASAAVWGAGTRTLTSGANIVLAKGVGLTGLNDLSAAQVNTEAAAVLANYDPPTKAELDAAVATLATPAQVLTQATAALNTYDPPTKAELDAAQAAITTAVNSRAAPADVTTALNNNATLTRLGGMLVQNGSDWQFTIVALANAPAGGGGGGTATLGNQQTIIKLLRADHFTDKTNPLEWHAVDMEEGTGAPGTGTELLRKKILDENGNPIHSTTVAIARLVTP